MLMIPACTSLLNSRLVYPTAYLTSPFGCLIATWNLNIFKMSSLHCSSHQATCATFPILIKDNSFYQLLWPKILVLFLTSFLPHFWVMSLNLQIYLEFVHYQTTFLPHSLSSTLATSKQFNMAARDSVKI